VRAQGEQPVHRQRDDEQDAHDGGGLLPEQRRIEPGVPRRERRGRAVDRGKQGTIRREDRERRPAGHRPQDPHLHVRLEHGVEPPRSGQLPEVDQLDQQHEAGARDEQHRLEPERVRPPELDPREQKEGCEEGKGGRPREHREHDEDRDCGGDHPLGGLAGPDALVGTGGEVHGEHGQHPAVNEEEPGPPGSVGHDPDRAPARAGRGADQERERPDRADEEDADAGEQCPEDPPDFVLPDR